MTKKNRRGRGVVAGTRSSGPKETELDSQSATEERARARRPSGDRERTPRADGDSTPDRNGSVSRIDVRLRQAYEPGWYRVLASEPAEHSVREDPMPTDSAGSSDPEPADHPASDRAGSRS